LNVWLVRFKNQSGCAPHVVTINCNYFPVQHSGIGLSNAAQFSVWCRNSMFILMHIHFSLQRVKSFGSFTFAL
jgi:hypothetical protein